MKTFIILAFALALVACGPDIGARSQQIKSEFESSLKPGDSYTKIEQYLDAKGLDFTYDKYAGRYQSIIRYKESDFQAIIIYVYVDNHRNYLRLEVLESFTAL